LSSEYIQFRILYILYDKFESEGNSRDVRVNEVFDDPELNYLQGKTVSIEVEYLAGKNFIRGSSRNGQSPFQYVKILSDGVEIIRYIMRDYPLTLMDSSDKEYKQKYNQISATQNLKGKRLEIFGFIKDHVEHFEGYLEKTRAISINPIPYSPSKPQVQNEDYEQLLNKIDQGKDEQFVMTRSCMNFRIYDLLKQNINQNIDTKYQQSVSLLLSLLNFPTVNLGSFGNEGEQIKDSKVQSYSCDIISFVNEINSCLVIDCTLSVPTEEKINRIYNTTSYLGEKLSTKLIPVIISAARVPSRDTATTAKVRVIDKSELNNIVELIDSEDIMEARKQFIQKLM
jgi:hypothetical protein